ncbi:vomeronasal type-2 receptor 26-like [Protopterus annectens]|uniref:vomeronasal type-2 receptor 26-like n=1 Tax=Protopterus annectens TaxID=7888 RepID=UPI001CFC111B|nr:vomeronasal type-2 receptor 26-like [Protopterus annectens]
MEKGSTTPQMDNVQMRAVIASNGTATTVTANNGFSSPSRLGGLPNLNGWLNNLPSLKSEPEEVHIGRLTGVNTTIKSNLGRFTYMLLKLRKLQLEVNYFTECIHEGVVPKCLRLWQYPTGLQDASDFHQELLALFNRHGTELMELLYHLKKVHFQTSDGEDLFFDENGDVVVRSDIVNWQLTPDGVMKSLTVGWSKPYTLHGQQLFVNNSAVVWSGGHFEVPKSVCSEACNAGYRRVIRQGEPPCCFDCIPCSDGEIANKSGKCICIKCPDDYWSNTEKDFCISKYIEFLSYEDPLGTSLAAIAVALSLMPVGVLCIFIKHHDTPVVKANNREISYFLLVILTLCLLASLIFIGHPRNETCIFRQPAFGIFFSICVSAVLAKTITVVIAFRATKPGSRLKNLFGSKTSFFTIVCCSVVEIIICIAWISVSPPFQETDKTYPQKTILQCNEGSAAMFYCMLGYLGILATISLLIAFHARNLPDSFNETKFITFSMIVFISVWLSFIPAYISTKGKYMVAVEIFAILSSSTGLLLCIFSPKCYIILLRPDMNTRRYLVRQNVA